MLRFYRDQYRGRLGKIFIASVFGAEKWAGLLWGVFILALGFLTRPVQSRIMSTWEGLPVWVVPVIVLAAVVILFVRGLLKANYEAFTELQKRADDDEAEKKRLEEKLTTAERRKELKTALAHAANEGEILHKDELTEERVNDWAFRVAAMISVALDPGAVHLFYNDFEVSVNAVAEDSEAKQAIRRRLKHLNDLIVRVDRDSLQVNPDFNHLDWIGHRPPRIKMTPQAQMLSARIEEIRADANRR